MKADQRIFIFGGQAADEVSDQVYAIKDTVNWYQVRDTLQLNSTVVQQHRVLVRRYTIHGVYLAAVFFHCKYGL